MIVNIRVIMGSIMIPFLMCVLNVEGEGGPRGPNALESRNAKISEEENATLYHYYPHNQHLFQLPECASQQVCNAVYLRLNYSTPLCACPEPSDPCSASTLPTDGHSLRFASDRKNKEVLTLAKTCEEVNTIRQCENNRDWSILALQNIRTGKAHYLVICTCPETEILEGPLAQTGAPYAKVPGIRVYGMLCIKKGKFRRRKAKLLWDDKKISSKPDFPQIPDHMWEAVNKD